MGGWFIFAMMEKQDLKKKKKSLLEEAQQSGGETKLSGRRPKGKIEKAKHIWDGRKSPISFSLLQFPLRISSVSQSLMLKGHMCTGDYFFT